MTALPGEHLAEQLRDIFVSFDRDADAAIARLSGLYDADIVFRDPLQTLIGRNAFLEMNRRIAKRARRLAFEVTDAMGGHDSLFLAWTMTYEPKKGRTIVFEGSTHARVRDGLITEQRDYWDLLSSVAQSFPVARSLYTALAPHLG